jgi:hypothetical protein
MNTSLVSVDSLFILDLEGKTLFSRHFTNASAGHELEQAAFNKTKKQKTNEIVAFRSSFLVFRQVADLLIYVVAAEGENEILIDHFINSFIDVLTGNLGSSSRTPGAVKISILDKRAFLEGYDVVAVVVDEMVESGIILEMDADVLSARLESMQKSYSTSILDAAVQDKTIAGAISVAKRFLMF